MKLLKAANVPQRVDDLLGDRAVGRVAAVLALDALDVDDVGRLVLGVEDRRRLLKKTVKLHWVALRRIA